eukprot:31373-Pelagococcus_subviridis.AAC.5
MDLLAVCASDAFDRARPDASRVSPLWRREMFSPAKKRRAARPRLARLRNISGASVSPTARFQHLILPLSTDRCSFLISAI